jgi:hypothetical protein
MSAESISGFCEHYNLPELRGMKKTNLLEYCEKNPKYLPLYYWVMMKLVEECDKESIMVPSHQTITLEIYSYSHLSWDQGIVIEVSFHSRKFIPPAPEPPDWRPTETIPEDYYAQE